MYFPSRYLIFISVNVMNNRQLLVIFNMSNYNNNCCRSNRLPNFRVGLEKEKGNCIEPADKKKTVNQNNRETLYSSCRGNAQKGSKLSIYWFVIIKGQTVK